MSASMSAAKRKERIGVGWVGGGGLVGGFYIRARICDMLVRGLLRSMAMASCEQASAYSATAVIVVVVTAVVFASLMLLVAQVLVFYFLSARRSSPAARTSRTARAEHNKQRAHADQCNPQDPLQHLR
jgi:hypothetical protein